MIKRRNFMAMPIAVLILSLMVNPVWGATAKTKVKPKTVTPVVKPVVKTIKIGLILPLTGDSKEYGESVKHAFQIALDQTKNKAGNFNVQTVLYDDKSDPKLAATGARKLITQDKVNLIFGSVSSICSIPISEVAETYKIPQITPTSTYPEVTVANGKRKSFIFRGAYIDSYQGNLAASFARDNLKVKTAAVMYNLEDSYSIDLAEGFKTTFEQNGGTVSAYEGYTEYQEDFSAILDRIDAKKPDIIFLPDYYYRVPLIAKQARNKGIKCTLLGGDGWDHEDLDYKALEGSYFINYSSPGDPNPVMQKFVQLYKTKYGTEPDAVATAAYDAANMALNAIRTANNSDPVKLRSALQATKDLPSSTGKLTIDNLGNPIKPGVVIQIKDEKPVYHATVLPPTSSVITSVMKVPEPALTDTVVDNITLTPFKDPYQEIDMLIPKGWVSLSTSDTSPEVIFQLTSSNDDKVFLVVETNPSLYEFLSTKGLDVGGTTIVKLFGMEVGDLTVLDNSRVQISGTQGIQYIATFTEQGQRYKLYERIVLKNGYCYDLLFKASTEVFDKYSDALIKCLDSIKINVPSEPKESSTPTDV